MQRAGIRAGITGGILGDLAGRSLVHLLGGKKTKKLTMDVPVVGDVPVPAKLQGVQSMISKESGLRGAMKVAYSGRHSIWRNGSAGYDLEDAASAPLFI